MDTEPEESTRTWEEWLATQAEVALTSSMGAEAEAEAAELSSVALFRVQVFPLLSRFLSSFIRSAAGALADTLYLLWEGRYF